VGPGLVRRPGRVSVSRTWRALAIPGLAWLVVFFGVAFYAIVSVGLGNVTTLYEPVARWNPLEWNVGYLLQAAEQLVPGGQTWDALVRTVLYVVAAIVISLLIGFPVAWYAARHAGRWRVPIIVLLVLPFWISYLMRMFAWTNLLAEDGYGTKILGWLAIDNLFQAVGLLEGDDWLAGQPIAVIMALVYGYVPYLILPLFASLDRIDPRLVEAARDLGAPPWAAFWRVVVPLARSGTLAGVMLLALPMLGDFYTADMISGSPSTSMIGNTINGYVQGGPEKALGAAMTIVMSALLVVFMLLYLRALRADQRAAEGR